MVECREWYESYECRLETFRNWKSDFPPCKLARAGFVYRNDNDVAVCLFCQVEGFSWQPNDNPLEDHIKWSPHCKFFSNNSIPFISKITNSVHSDRITFDSRIKTFGDSSVSNNMRQKSAELAKSGYFCTGQGNIIKCFHCGTSITNLSPTDDVNQLHALIYDKCEYLQLYSGKEETIQHLFCNICMTDKPSVLFLPCKHVASCINCSVNLDQCCICRKIISGYIRVYFS